MPNFTYTRDRPAGDLSPAAQRGTLVTNTNSVDSILEVDLYGFNDNNGGHHQKSTYVVQGTDPTPVDTNGAQGILYAKTANAIAELFVSRFGEATAVQMTNGDVSATAEGYTFLPGGLLLQWGNKTMSSASETVTFPKAFTTSVFNVQATVRAIGAFYAGCRVPGPTTVVIDIQSTGIGQVVYWMAVGV